MTMPAIYLVILSCVTWCAGRAITAIPMPDIATCEREAARTPGTNGWSAFCVDTRKDPPR